MKTLDVARFFALLFWPLFATSAQQTNAPTAILIVNGGTPSAVGMGPLSTTAFVGTPANVRIVGDPTTPVLLIYGDYSPGVLAVAGSSVDIIDRGGLYGGQIIFSGWTNPAFTTNALGTYVLSAAFTCPLPGNPIGCTPLVPFTQALQAVVVNASNPPTNIRTTAAVLVSMFSGGTIFNLSQLSGDSSILVPFPTGFTFNFYGINYSSAYVSANGFVSFGSADNGFAAPDVSSLRGGVPRIAALYSDLEPQPGASPTSDDPRIFSHSLTVNGQTVLRFVWDYIADFGYQTGPRGAELAIFANGDISVFVAPYSPSPVNILTAVGITPGSNIDPGGAVPGQTTFGRDLSVDAATGPTPLGVNRIGFEVFTGLASAIPSNVIDLAGFNYVPGLVPQNGIRFLRNPLVVGPGIAEYIVN